MILVNAKLAIILVFYLLFFEPIIGYNQGKSPHVLIDRKTNEPVPYALIGAGSYHVHSNHVGHFYFDSLKSDSLSISRLGYKTMKVLQSDIKDTIYIEPEVFFLDPVEVHPEEKIFHGGYHDLHSDGLAKGGMKNGKGVRICTTHSKFVITSVLVHTKRNRKGYVYQIGIFNIDSDGLPGDLIFIKEYTSPNGQNLLKIPMQEGVIVNSESVAITFVRLYGMEESRNEPYLRLTKEVDSNMSFFYSPPTNKWHHLPFYSTLGFYWNYKIGIEYVLDKGD